MDALLYPYESFRRKEDVFLPILITSSTLSANLTAIYKKFIKNFAKCLDIFEKMGIMIV